MIDNDMNNILKNFAGAEAGTGEVTDAKTGKQKVSAAATEKNAMKSLLEGLDSAQKSVSQMPATHKMAKNTATKHPAGNFLVGGEFDNDGQELEEGFESPKSIAIELDAMYRNNENGVQEKMANSPEPYRTLMYTLLPNAEEIDGTKQYHDILDHLEALWNDEEVTNPTMSESGDLRTVKITYSNGESVTTNVAADASDELIYDYYAIGKRFNLGDGAGGDNVVTVKNVEILEAAQDTYEDTISKREQPRTQMNKKQSLADVFRSMDETEDDMTTRFKKELHDEKTSRALSKGDNGKFNLAEEDSGWGDELIEALRLLLQQNPHSPYEVVAGVEDLIQQYETPTLNQDQL